MTAMYTTKSENLELVDHGLQDKNVSSLASLQENLVCNFLRVIQGSSTYVLVEAESAGSFSWVFSINGTVTSMQGQYLDVGQRAEAYSRADKGETVGINCG